MPNAVDLKRERRTLVGRMWDIQNQAEAESRDLTAEEEANWTAVETQVTALDKRIARQEALEREPAHDPEQRGFESRRVLETGSIPRGQRPLLYRALPEYKEAFYAWMLGGDAGLTAEQRQLLVAGRETRALATQALTAGGYFIDDTLQRAVEQAMSWYGGMLEMSSFMDTDDGADVSLPMSNDTTNAGRRLAENTVLTQTDPSIQLKTWRAYTYTSDLVLVPVQLIQDSVISVDDWLQSILAERIGRAQNTDFTLEAAPNGPQGLVPVTVVGRAAPTGQSTTIAADDLIFLEHAVNIAYRRGPGTGWMMHDQTLRDIRRLKDGDGQYLFQPGLTAGAPSTINGYPYVVNNDMATMAASARAVLFGKLSKYRIRRVRGIQFVRLSERYADALQVGFFAFARADGGLIDAGGNPIQHYANSAS